MRSHEPDPTPRRPLEDLRLAADADVIARLEGAGHPFGRVPESRPDAPRLVAQLQVKGPRRSSRAPDPQSRGRRNSIPVAQCGGLGRGETLGDALRRRAPVDEPPGAPETNRMAAGILWRTRGGD
jgi:hypothetical protein